MSEKFIEFTYDKTLKQPKWVQNNVFVLSSSERIKIQPGESKKIDMKLSICLPEQIIKCCTLLPTFHKNGLKLENCQYISTDNNIINFNQPINLPWKLKMYLVNRSMNATFLKRKKTRISFYRTIKQRIRTIKSQVYKNMKIFYKKWTIYNKKLDTNQNLLFLWHSMFFFLLPFYFLLIKFSSRFNQNCLCF